MNNTSSTTPHGNVGTTIALGNEKNIAMKGSKSTASLKGQKNCYSKEMHVATSNLDILGKPKVGSPGILMKRY